VRESGLVGVGVILGWLASKTWSDPGCQLGLVVFLVATAAMALGFLLVLVGQRRDARDDYDEDDEDDRP
jgi:hypothetical protein